MESNVGQGATAPALPCGSGLSGEVAIWKISLAAGLDESVSSPLGQGSTTMVAR